MRGPTPVPAYLSRYSGIATHAETVPPPPPAPIGVGWSRGCWSEPGLQVEPGLLVRRVTRTSSRECPTARAARRAPTTRHCLPTVPGAVMSPPPPRLLTDHLASPVGHRSEDALHHGQVFPVVVRLEQRQAQIQLEQDTADTPDITWLRPADLCRVRSDQVRSGQVIPPGHWHQIRSKRFSDSITSSDDTAYDHDLSPISSLAQCDMDLSSFSFNAGLLAFESISPLGPTLTS